MRKLLLNTALMLSLSGLSATPVLAQSAAAEGPGTRSCGDLIEAKDSKPDNYREFAVWMSGFLTAANAYEEDTFDLTPWQPIELSIAQVAKFCDANPGASVSQAMAAYIRFLKPNRLTEQETLTSLRNGKNAVFVYPTVLLQLRTKLIELGYLNDTASTEFGKELGEALLRYQREKGIEPSGLPDGRTLLSLLN